MEIICLIIFIIYNCTYEFITDYLLNHFEIKTSEGVCHEFLRYQLRITPITNTLEPLDITHLYIEIITKYCKMDTEVVYQSYPIHNVVR